MKPLAYIMGTFPTITETFIHGEIQALCVQGVELHVFALRQPMGAARHSQEADSGATIHYAPALLCRRLWQANLRMLRAVPRRYLRILGGLLARTVVNPIHCIKTLGIFPIAVAFAEAVAERGIGHIHAHWANYPATVAYIISRLLNVPFSFTAHAYDASLVRAMMKEKVREAEFIVTCTRLNRRFLTTLVPESTAKILVNHHGIFLDTFLPNGKRILQQQHEYYILSCGSLYPRKGFPDLIEACRLLRDRGWKFRCEIVGEGPLRRQLERLIKTHRLEDIVTLRGAVFHKEIVDYYRQADLFVLPCITDYLRWEELFTEPVLLLEVGLAAPFRPITDGIPNVLVEAMAMGIPVVSTRAGAVPELIRDGRTGTLVPERDPVALASAIDNLLKHPDWRQGLAREARETVQHYFDRSKNIRELLTMFAARLQTNGNRANGTGIRSWG